MLVINDELQENLMKLFLEEGLLTDTDLTASINKSKAENRPLVNVLSEMELVDDELIVHGVTHLSGNTYVDLSSGVVSQDYLNIIPQDIAERFMAVPIYQTDDSVTIAMLDGNNVQAVDYLSNRVQKNVRIVIASEKGIRRVLDQYKTDLSSVNVAAVESQSEDAMASIGNIKTIVQDSPISRALTTILEYAVKSKASDIHIEPLEDSLKIRYRVDGVLREIMQLPKTIEPALVSRVKILSELKIDEHRIPQDGQATVLVNGKEIDLRIAISPVVWGEQVVVRLLDKTGSNFKLEDMGYAGRALRTVKKGISQPHGMVLTSGPTGSGKTTSMYALIKEIKNETVNIVTLEDPVEYKIQGVNQIQVNPEVGLTFASGLRSILRQDPDVVMVGEMRDNETARLGVQAALTGHLVFSTLHTNSAAGVLPRLLDMKVEPFLIASTVNTIIGQRLVRRVASSRDTYWSNALETRNILDNIGHLLPKTREEVARVSSDLGYKDLPLANQKAYPLVKGHDTALTPGGYSGRVGLYEVMDVNSAIQEMISSRATTSEIQRKSIENGMITMRQDGYLKALQGITTLDEVNRVTSDTI